LTSWKNGEGVAKECCVVLDGAQGAIIKGRSVVAVEGRKSDKQNIKIRSEREEALTISKNESCNILLGRYSHVEGLGTEKYGRDDGKEEDQPWRMGICRRSSCQPGCSRSHDGQVQEWTLTRLIGSLCPFECLSKSTLPTAFTK
jgi:hypothetical protein